MARWILTLVVLVMSLASGCKSADRVRDPEFAAVSYAVRRSTFTPSAVEQAVAPVVPELEGPQAVETYLQYALSQNPEVHAARKRIESLAYRVPVVSSLPDPMLNVTAQPEPVQTAAGQQELIMAATQKLPWFGKRSTQADVARAQTHVARAQLAAVELATVAKVKRAYYELYFIQRAIETTEADQRLLSEIREVAYSRYSTGQTNQQDVLRADLEISNVESELIRLRQQLNSGQAKLARLLHIAPQTNVLAVDELSREQVPQDLDALQRTAVAARPELHAQLAALRRDQLSVELARLDYKPDVTLGVSWIDVASAGISPVASGRDAFLLTAGVNLPVYQQRLDSSVRSAEAQAVATAREYDALRDETLEEVTSLFAQASSQQELITLFDNDILPKARQTLDVSSRAYNVGEVDFLQLLDNWRQLLRYEVTYRRIESSLLQTLAELEKQVGGVSIESELLQDVAEVPVEPLPIPDQRTPRVIP